MICVSCAPPDSKIGIDTHHRLVCCVRVLFHSKQSIGPIKKKNSRSLAHRFPAAAAAAPAAVAVSNPDEIDIDLDDGDGSGGGGIDVAERAVPAAVFGGAGRMGAE